MGKIKLFILLMIPFLMGADIKVRNDVTDYCADANIVGCWRFNEDVGRAIDESGSDNHCSLSTPAYTTAGCQEGNCYTFNGTTDDLDCGQDASLNFGGTISISTWVKSSASTFQYIISTRLATGAFYYIRLDDDGSLNAAITDGTDSVSLAPVDTANDGNWHHIVMTIDNTDSSGAILYLDGSVVAVSNPTLVNTFSLADQFSIGGNVGENKQYLNGLADEISVWNRELTAAEVLDIYENGLR